MHDENQKLSTIIDLSYELARIYDLDLLLEKILERARAFANADAGSIYIREDNRLHFSQSQNETLRKRLKPGKKLLFTTFTIPINHNSIAGYVASTGKVIYLKNAHRLPPSVPYHFDKEFDKLSNYHTKSMLTIPCNNSAGEVVGILQLINAQDENGKQVPFNKADHRLYNHFAFNAAIAIERAQLFRAFILRTISMSELRDPGETGVHVNRVGAYAIEIYETWARNNGVGEAEIDHQRDILRMAAMLHDVGKVAISDMILKKPGRFTPEEYEVMKAHTYLGARLFANPTLPFDKAAVDVILNHHERWDGKGYPGYIDINTGKALAGQCD